MPRSYASLLAVLILAGCGEEPKRLDGSDTAAFKNSLKNMLADMTLEESREFMMMFMGVAVIEMRKPVDGVSPDWDHVRRKLDGLSAADLRERIARLGPEWTESKKLLKWQVFEDMRRAWRREEIRELEKKQSSDSLGPILPGDRNRLITLMQKGAWQKIKKLNDPNRGDDPDDVLEEAKLLVELERCRAKEDCIKRGLAFYSLTGVFQGVEG